MPQTPALIKNENQIDVIKGQNLLISKITFAGGTPAIAGADLEISNAKINQTKFLIKQDPTGVIEMEIPLIAEGSDVNYKKGGVTATVEVKLGGKTYEFVGGKYDPSSTAKKIILKNLKAPKKFKIDIEGTITIGTETEKSTINVNAGNNNPNEDWIIQTINDKKTGDPSNINVKGLLNWMEGQITVNGSLSPKLSVPEKEGPEKERDLGDFIIDINELKLNLSQATFRVDLASQKGTKLQLTTGIELSNMSFKMSYDYDARVENSYDE